MINFIKRNKYLLLVILVLVMGGKDYFIPGPGDNMQSLSFRDMSTIAQRVGSPGMSVTVKGFYKAGDGGGGLFHWDDTSTAAPVPGMIIKNVGTNVGAWVRDFMDRINIKWLGAIGDGSFNCTNAIQAAINYASTYGGNNGTITVYIPHGTYAIDHLDWKLCRIQGDNRRSRLTARVSGNSYLITLASSPLSEVEWNSVSLIGNAANLTQGCFDLTAVPQTVPSYTGGFWYSEMANVSISGFNGHSIHFLAQDGLGDVANQFLTLRRIRVTSPGVDGAIPLYIEGQMAQLTVQDCEFDGVGASNLTSVGVKLVSQQTSNDFVWGAIQFNNVTIQNVHMAFYSDFAQGVLFSNGWLENDSIGFYCKNNSRVQIEHNHIANVANGPGTYIVGNDNSVVDFCSNGLYGNIVGRVYTSPNGVSGGGDMRSNYFQGLGSMVTVFTATNVNPVSNTLNTTYFRDIVTTATYSKSSYIVNINSSLGINEFITVRCDDRANPGGFVAFKPGIGNIDCPSLTDSGFFVIRGRQSVILRRSDLLGNWVIVTPPPAPIYVDTIPAVYSAYTGEHLMANAPTSGHPYMWVCTQGGIPGTWTAINMP